MFACTLFGIDRQVYYRKIKRRKHKQLKASKVVSLVIEIRQSMPRIGAKKMYYLLNNEEFGYCLLYLLFLIKAP